MLQLQEPGCPRSPCSGHYAVASPLIPSRARLVLSTGALCQELTSGKLEVFGCCMKQSPAWNGGPSSAFMAAIWWSLTHLDSSFSTAKGAVRFKWATILVHVLHCSLKQASKEFLSVSASVYYSLCHHPRWAKPRDTFFLETSVFKGFLLSGSIYWGPA